MAVHDWTQVDAGTFHAFHTAWITHLSETLNGGLLPSGYYALPEQHAGRLIADVLTLQGPVSAVPLLPAGEGGVAVAEAPPRVRRRLSPSPAARASRRTLTIRHISGHQIIALVEIVSPANKDRATHVTEFSDKVETALWHGIHVLVVDLFPSGKHDPQGMHGVIWEQFDDQPYLLPPDEVLTLSAYVAGACPEAYVEHLAVGSCLTEMPLFLTPERYINVPLEATYLAAYRGLPAFWRAVLQGHETPPPMRQA
ncbi:MAG: DUF4058 family protein [Planctomycetota bacterium]|nr:DUF4058 family protein [Planctomycetota bacterium]